jgi:Rrf2 family protein
MLKLTKKADYGLIALRHLAVGSGKPSASAKEFSDRYGMPLPLLSKILQKLARGGFLRSEHGANGGYRLARDPRQVSALEVIRAIDGPIILMSCFTGQKKCGQSGTCTVREPLRRVHQGILNLLENITISDMAQDEAGDAGAVLAALPSRE